ncbi:MAG: hypothetical protein HFG64_16685 [Lachnospiraceae bacterium]|nr:hypothetical protein [Lachnospiraceae bacterium]
MNVKTAEGLIGASAGNSMAGVSLRIAKEAEAKGDTGAMERAMGYAKDMNHQAERYRARAEEGMQEEAKETKEKEKLEQEAAIEKRRQENREAKARLEESEKSPVDTVEISGEGKAHLESSRAAEAVPPSMDTAEFPGGSPAYTKAGEISQAAQPVNISVSV